MNTPYSMAIGWGSLLLAGGGAYYYAKKDINDRRDRDHKKRLSHTSGVAMQRHQVEHAHQVSGQANGDVLQDSTTPGPAKYRLAKGNATEGRDRGDRL
ncbi:protein of unknown function [Taphrina deformans PYCC 5710]|uniref:Uncharacterized protein n=1 Tax=Taphrina deformans (strain PYCC 5710 / ATCC 11124 / CBS 356.35 / IMI 108563 / JCM 9778 / NBRC 8474) TaxID=1097556 RepID=R4XI55_TAPDE|nr:protein of unknown function [Taphrina deformans PYCC 5710]|eukprot:CCG84159.1 protein of unknown function [Taphrina deformans PYCC 5710]